MIETQSQLPFLMTAAEISARIKKINARTLKRARERGDIKGYLHGGKWVFEVPSVLVWITGKKTSPPEPVTRTGSIASAKRPRGRPRKVQQKEVGSDVTETFDYKGRKVIS